MMDGVRDGKIDTIIVKDLSRFGRDYIGVGEYMEQIFPLLGVRLIAINDNYDSNNYKGITLGMDVVVSNLVNTMYCRDAGKKLRTANQVKWRKGITTASAAPFGYQFDPDKKGAFIIDPPAAKIVRRIFDLAILGLGTRDIAMMMRDAKDQKMDLIICASISRFARNFSDCMTQIAALKTMHPAHPIGVYFETENIYTLNPSSQYSLDIQALLADWESGNKSRRMILSYDQRIMTGQYPVADLMGYRHTKDGRLVIEPEEAKTVRFIFLAFIQGYNYDQIAAVLTQKKRSTLRGRQEWNGMMVANIMKNERRWGDLEARKSIVVDYKLGKVTKNNGNRCSAYVPEHHEAIVSPEIARAAHLVASSSKKCGVQDIVVIRQGALKGFVGIHPNWSGINAESIRSLCLSTYLPEEVMKLNDIAEMRAGATLGKALQSEYMTVSGTCFINQSSPVMTISKNGIRFSKACHSRLDDCEYVELLYHPILQVVILRKSNHGFSTAMHWRDDNDVHSVFSARAFSGLVFQTLNWKMNYRYQCRGICRGQGNAKFLIFELDESRILTGRNQYEQENCSMNLKCRLYRSKWVQSITVNDVMESGQVVENPMIGAIPSKNEVQRELDDLLMSM